jgi:trimeric autotransporter adhesin
MKSTFSVSGKRSTTALKSKIFHGIPMDRYSNPSICNRNSIKDAVGRISVILFLCGIQFGTLAQGAISINNTGTSPDSSAILDLQSTSKGLLVPRMTKIQREGIGAPATGLIVYDLDANSFWCYAGSSWIEVLAGFTTLVRDADNDTRVVVENTPDEDTIRFTVAGTEMAKMDGRTFHLKAPGNSTFIGDRTGIADNGNFNYNVGLGRDVLKLNTNGKFNTGVGALALAKTNGASVNSAFGYLALTSNSSGNNNSGFGAQALQFNNIGENNSAFGHRSLLYNTTGSGNIGIGYHANQRNQTGSNNTVVGTEAGGYDSFHSKSGNVFLGFRAGYNALGDNKLYIHNDSSSTPLIYGDFATGVVNVNGKLSASQGFSDLDQDTRIELEASPDEDTIRFIVGGSEMALMDGKTMHLKAPGNSLFIGRNAGISDDSTDNRNVFIGPSTGKSNTSGSQNTFIGVTAGKSNLNGPGNTFIGWATGFSNMSGAGNSFLGSGSGFSNTTGSRNTFVGVGTGEVNDDGMDNTFVGSYAGQSNISGNGNISIGFEALNLNTTGDHNIAIGRSALINNQTGIENTAIGAWSLSGAVASVKNTAIGHSAMASMSTGKDNTAVGHNSMFTNSIGDFNSAFGVDAMYYNTDGYSNTAFGHSSLKSNTGGYYNVGIGVSALTVNVDGRKNVALGTGAMTENSSGNDNVAIGQEANRYNETGSQNVIVGFEAGRGGGQHSKSGNVLIGYQAGYNELGDNKLYIENSNSAAPLIFGDFTNGSELVGINGDLGIGTQAPKQRLHVKKDGIDSVQTIVAVLESSVSNRPLLLFSENSSNDTTSGMSIEYNGAAGFAGNNEMYINKTGGVSMVTFENSGKVGIATTNPATQLQVEGGSDVSLASGGYFAVGSVDGLNITMDNNEIMARNNSAKSTLHAQTDGGDFHVHFGLPVINEFVVKDDGKVGIGVNSPTDKLHVNSAVGQDAVQIQVNGGTKFRIFDSGGISIFSDVDPGADVLRIETGTRDLIIESDADRPVIRPSVSGYGKVGTASNVFGQVHAALFFGTYLAPSDIRLKEDVQIIEKPIEILKELNGVTYAFKKEHFYKGDRRWNECVRTNQLGLIAQDLETVLPQLVHTDAETGMKSVEYIGLIPVLIEAIKEQQGMIDELQTQVLALSAEIPDLERRTD